MKKYYIYITPEERNLIIELTPIIVNKLIKKIVIHKNGKKHSHNNVKVDIYFTAVDLFTVPQEQELLQMMEEIRKEKEISLKPHK